MANHEGFQLPTGYTGFTGNYRQTLRVQELGQGAGFEQPARNGFLVLTFMEQGQTLAKVKVSLAKDRTVSFGRQGCDVTVNPPSQTVSTKHGYIIVRNGQCYLQDNNSTNGLFLNGVRQSTCRVSSGDIITVGQPMPGCTRTIIMVCTPEMQWSALSLEGQQRLTLGRFTDNNIILPNPTISAHHACLARGADGSWMISDLGSSNGTRVAGQFLPRGIWAQLLSGFPIILGNVQAVFMDTCLVIFNERQGVDVACEGLTRFRKNHGRVVVTNEDISLHIKRGEFVAIVGGSGSGKSTLLNELNGTEPADRGRVTIDGVDLYDNYETLKTSIGYVPQEDIVYDNLTLESMLDSAAKLRMTPDTTPQERKYRVNEIINLLELNHVRTNMIGSLSGGQKKRASIAVELLADPRLLFLDEPTSGLDPGIERRLMETLSKMAHDGRTIILVTHTTLNLHLCDQVIFLGQGGKLCFAGRPEEAKAFFNVADLVDAYNKISDNPDMWQSHFASTLASQTQLPPRQGHASRARRLPNPFSQFLTLSLRYMRLIINDHSRLILLLTQGPLLACVIAIVASTDCFTVYERGKSCMFALSCAAFWLGIFDSIQEVCKERDIFMREYGGGVRLGSYVSSKIAVLGLLCTIQAFLLCTVFLATAEIIGKTGSGISYGCIFRSAFLELMVSMLLLTLSAMSLGLLVSSLFRNPDRAIALAPLLIMPQLLFAGVIFKLEPGSISERLSYAVNCRWGMEALGTTIDLDSMDLAIYGTTITVPAQDKMLHDIKVEVPGSTVETPNGPMQIEGRTETINNHKVHIDEQEKIIGDSMIEHNPEKLDNNMYERTREHLLRTWGMLAAMSLICILGSHLALFKATRR